jgi:hypothetical protein
MEFSTQGHGVRVARDAGFVFVSGVCRGGREKALLAGRKGIRLAVLPIAAPTAQNQTPPPKGQRPWRTSEILGALLILAVVAWSYSGALVELAYRWAREPDYSHGFLVPAFSGYLLWARRKALESHTGFGSWWGLVPLFCAAAMHWYSAYAFYPLLDAPSLMPCLAGVTLVVGGWTALKWAWPGIIYLAFMMPLPGFLAGSLPVI